MSEPVFSSGPSVGLDRSEATRTVPGPCPFCGWHADPDDLDDVVYPTGSYWVQLPGGQGRAYGDQLWATQHLAGVMELPNAFGRCWAVHCTENMGGCGAQISGDSEEEAIAAWNRRPTEEAIK